MQPVPGEIESTDVSEHSPQWQCLAAEIRAEAATLPKPLADWRIDERVLDAMSRVPRERFMQAWPRQAAYANRPAPIGHGQTISQPFIVALMTDLLRVRAQDRVLEVGTGSGYQAAVLAELVSHVYSTELIEPLANRARDLLRSLGYDNVDVRASDGCCGWQEHAPFDAVIVTAAGAAVPPELVAQLRNGGRLIMPVVGAAGLQWLTVVDKTAAGAVHEYTVLPVSFVALRSGVSQSA